MRSGTLCGRDQFDAGICAVSARGRGNKALLQIKRYLEDTRMEDITRVFNYPKQYWFWVECCCNRKEMKNGNIMKFKGNRACI